MAFEKLQFTKSWENAADFPTYEPSEAQVRADLQRLHDEARDGINRLVDALNDPAAAAQLPFQGEGLTAENVQDAVLEVYGAVQNAAAGQIVNGSVTKEKLAAALLARTYGGLPWVSVDTPNSGDNPDTDFPLGQAWLRPGFTVVNEAGDDWTGSGCTAEKTGDDVILTGNGQVASASAAQSLAGIGSQGDRVRILFTVKDQDSEITALTASVNGETARAVSGDAVLEGTLSANGTLTVQVAVTWPSASLADGSVTLGNYAVVNLDKIMREAQGAGEMADWNGYLRGLLPLSGYRSPEALFFQEKAGNWIRMGFDVLPPERGGTGLGTLGEENSVLQVQSGKPAWCVPDQTIGFLRLRTGSYTGDGKTRTVTLPVSPKVLVIWPESGPEGVTYDVHNYLFKDNPIVLCDGATAGEGYYGTIGDSTYTYYYCKVSLSGASLSFTGNLNGVQDASVRYGNRSGVVYRWAALY